MEWNKNRMFKVEPNEVQLFFHIKNNITWPHTANNPIRGTTAIPQKILFISRTDTVLPRRNSMNNAKSIISGTTLTGYENMANISQAANAAFNVLSSEKTNGEQEQYKPAHSGFHCNMQQFIIGISHVVSYIQKSELRMISEIIRLIEHVFLFKRESIQ